MKCVEVYKKLYHQEPFDVAFCPYRISPLGAHIDHQYGKINGLAINKGIHMAYHLKQNGVVELQSLNFPKRAQFFVSAVPEEKQGDWADHLRGTAKMLGEKYRLKVGLSGIIEGSLPIGGLSSSASVIICLLAYPEYGRRFCRKFLKILFGREFKNLNIVTQKSYGGRDTGLHGARLDVYIEEGDEVEIDSSNVSTIYDIEPDKNNKRKDIDFIAQRTRFYHAIIDSRSLKSGQSYDKLKKVFVIFICPYDPFGDDRMIYTIRNHCVENPELPYEDGARTIFLYTKGRKGRDNESLSQLLDYMENTTRENAVSEELEAIQEMVDVVKEDAEVTVAYMKGFERDQMFLEEGKELGRRLEQENTLREKNRADTEKNRADTEKNRADTEKNRADTEKNRADAEKHRAEEERQRADAAVEEIEKLRRQLEELQKQ